MGIDFLDILIRIEKRFSLPDIVRLHWDELFTRHTPPDLTVGELAEAVEWLRQGRPPEAQSEVAHSEAARGRPVLHYYSHPPWPPQNGEFSEDTWAGVKEVVVAALGAKPEKVTPTARLIHDLGMT